MEKTLEDLRAENAAEEAAKAQAPQPGAVEVDDAAADDQTHDDDHADDQDDEDGQKAEPESWMKGDDQESQGAEKKFTDKDIGAAKAKVRAKLEKREQEHLSEIEKLRADLDLLRQNTVAPQVSARPKREDFYDQDDPGDAYTEALVDWKTKKQLNEQHQASQQHDMQRKGLEYQQKIETGVDQHYERAVALATASGISPELYRSADLRVRSAIEGLFPGHGEKFTNSLIANLGEGSEKVFYSLGVSPKRLAELTSKLAEDPTGLQAAAYLGKLSAELTAPLRKKSNTPAPATNVQGDANTTDAGKGLQRKYMEARKRGDSQAAFDIRREARAKNINVSSW